METIPNFWTRGIKKAVVNINDVIAHKLLGMDVWEQAEIDKSTVETLDGTKNLRGLSEVSLCTYISKLAGKPTDCFVMPVPSFNVIGVGSRAGNCLACPEFLTVPTGAGTLILKSFTC